MEHTASTLTNGKVLVIGGYNDYYLNSTELYDPSIGNLVNYSKHECCSNGLHTASTLTNGKVLVAGGDNNGWCSK